MITLKIGQIWRRNAVHSRFVVVEAIGRPNPERVYVRSCTCLGELLSHSHTQALALERFGASELAYGLQLYRDRTCRGGSA